MTQKFDLKREINLKKIFYNNINTFINFSGSHDIFFSWNLVSFFKSKQIAFFVVFLPTCSLILTDRGLRKNSLSAYQNLPS